MYLQHRRTFGTLHPLDTLEDNGVPSQDILLIYYQILYFTIQQLMSFFITTSTSFSFSHHISCLMCHLQNKILHCWFFPLVFHIPILYPVLLFLKGNIKCEFLLVNNVVTAFLNLSVNIDLITFELVITNQSPFCCLQIHC